MSSLSNGIKGIFGGGDKIIQEQIEDYEETIAKIEKGLITPIDAYYTLTGNQDLSSLEEIKSSKLFAESLNDEVKEAIIIQLEEQFNQLKTEFNHVQENNGLISGTWDKIKNWTGIGASSNKTQVEIDELEEQLAKLKQNPNDLASIFKNITGSNLSIDSLNSILSNEEGKNITSISKAGISLNNYSEGQKMATDTVADILSGIIAVGAVVLSGVSGGTSLLIAAGAGCISKVCIKSLDCIGNPKKYSLKDFGYDVATGGINGAMAPVSNALAGSIGKMVMKAFGMPALETTIKSGTLLLAKETAEKIAETTVKQTGKQTLKQVSAKTVSFIAESAIDGGFSGFFDGASRALGEGRYSDIISDGFNSAKGGLIASPLIGAGFIGASKVGSKLGQTAGGQIIRKTTKKAVGIIGKGFDAILPNGIKRIIKQGEQKLGEKVTKNILKNSVTELDDDILSIKVGNYNVQVLKSELSGEMLDSLSNGDNGPVLDYANQVLNEALNPNIKKEAVVDIVNDDIEFESDSDIISELSDDDFLKELFSDDYDDFGLASATQDNGFNSFLKKYHVFQTDISKEKVQLLKDLDEDVLEIVSANNIFSKRLLFDDDLNLESVKASLDFIQDLLPRISEEQHFNLKQNDLLTCFIDPKFDIDSMKALIQTFESVRVGDSNLFHFVDLVSLFLQKDDLSEAIIRTNKFIEFFTNSSPEISKIIVDNKKFLNRLLFKSGSVDYKIVGKNIKIFETLSNLANLNLSSIKNFDFITDPNFDMNNLNKLFKTLSEVEYDDGINLLDIVDLNKILNGKNIDFSKASDFLDYVNKSFDCVGDKKFNLANFMNPNYLNKIILDSEYNLDKLIRFSECLKKNYFNNKITSHDIFKLIELFDENDINPDKFIDSYSFFKNLKNDDNKRMIDLKDNERLLKLISADSIEENEDYVRKLFLLTRDGILDEKIVNYVPEKGYIIDPVKNDIDKLYHAQELGIEAIDIFVPKFKSLDNLSPDVKVGDVFQLEDEKYIRIMQKDGTTLPLNISRKTYFELFPPVKRYGTVQNKIGNCWEITAINAILSDDVARAKVLKLFYEDGDDIILKVPHEYVSDFRFKDGFLPDDIDLKYYSVGSSGVNMLEYANGMICFVNRIKATYENIQEQILKATTQDEIDSLTQKLLNFTEFIEQNKDNLINTNFDSETFEWSKYSGEFDNVISQNRKGGRSSVLFSNFGFDEAEKIEKFSDFDKLSPELFDKYLVGCGFYAVDDDLVIRSKHQYRIYPDMIDENGTITSFKLINPWGVFETKLHREDLYRLKSIQIDIALK